MGDSPIAAGPTLDHLLLGDDQQDELLALEPLLDTLEETFVGGGAAVEDAGDEGMSDADAPVLPAIFPGVDQADAPGIVPRMGGHRPEDELPMTGLALPELHFVVALREHHFGRFYGLDDFATVDGQRTFGIEVVAGLAIKCELHNEKCLMV